MVETGPILEMIATLLEPMRFIPAEIRKLGITVATIARNTPYQINSEERPMIS